MERTKPQGRSAAVPSMLDGEAFARAWEAVQAQYADLPGEDGAARRAAAYAPFFLQFGAKVFIAQGCRFYHPQRIAIEDDARFNEHALVYGSGGVRIGRHARIGPRFFLHSANHEITPSPLAFHERGYEYASVVIGDNVLVSANVSVLPGATIGAGSFVAAGAVVTSRVHDDDARLFGTPARPMQLGADELKSSPAAAILIVGERGDRRREALRRIAATLGLPQVAVASPDEVPAFGSAVRAILALDGSSANATPGTRVWTLRTGTPVTDATVTFEIDGADPVTLATKRTLTTAPARSERPLIDDAANITLYNALKRLRKRRREPTDQVDLLVAALLLARTPEHAALAGCKRQLTAILEQEDAELAAAARAIERNESLEPVAAAIIARSTASAAVKARMRAKKDLDLAERVTHTCPELLVALACLDSSGDRKGRDAALARLDGSIASADKAWHLLAIGAAAAIIGRADLCERVTLRLREPAFLDDHAGCVRSAATAASGFSYCCGIGVLLAIAAATELPTFRLAFENEQAFPLRFGSVGRGTGGPVCLRGHGRMADAGTRQIDASLVDLWIDAVTPPSVHAAQVELTDAMYEPLVPTLEAAWRAIFRAMLHEAGEPFIEILPWPGGRSAALSVRYDIDRSTQPGQVRKIIEIQRSDLGGPCGSWYAIPGTDHGSRIEPVLRQHLQEIGLHGLRSDHREAHGAGVTMHSAPRSEYWRGMSTLAGQAKAGAIYSELLSVSLDRPQPMWADGDEAADLWVTPLHFPLEGSTNDTDLSYFDRLAPLARARVKRGGHLIIGSHPDLNQEILSKLARRESLDACWVAPVATVIERCRRLLAPGAVRAVRPAGATSESRLALVTTATVADVAVRIERAGSPVSIEIVQLNAGQPRPIEQAPSAH